MVLVFNSCTKDENPIETIEETNQQITEYFNYQIGNISNFKSIISDRQNNTILEADRISTVASQMDIESKEYFVLNEQINFVNSTATNEIFLSFKESTLQQLIDTSGAALLIPDSLKSSLVIDLSEASTLFKYPINVGDNWEVFSANIVMGTYKINVISITANYEGNEEINLGLNYGTVNTEKITYTILLNFPDMSNPFLPNKQYYYTDIWFSKGLGLVKFSGSKFFTNFLVGGEINMNDTLYVENQILN
jgi:hypothetical protein